MAGEDGIKATGKIVEILSERLYRAELANGHRLLAHMPGRRKLNLERLSLGDLVNIRMSPYDLSKGCIMVEDE